MTGVNNLNKPGRDETCLPVPAACPLDEVVVEDDEDV